MARDTFMSGRCVRATVTLTRTPPLDKLPILQVRCIAQATRTPVAPQGDDPTQTTRPESSPAKAACTAAALAVCASALAKPMLLALLPLSIHRAYVYRCSRLLAKLRRRRKAEATIPTPLSGEVNTPHWLVALSPLYTTARFPQTRKDLKRWAPEAPNAARASEARKKDGLEEIKGKGEGEANRWGNSCREPLPAPNV
jgi:hypothetical protein